MGCRRHTHLLFERSEYVEVIHESAARHKSSPNESPMVQALITGRRQRGTSTIPGGGPQRYVVDAGPYPRQQGERRIDRVLAIALDPAG